MKLIDKSALVAEIEKRIKEIDEIGTYLSPKGILTNLLCHINTLEVKEVDLEKHQKENIDLEKEVNQYFEKTWPFEEDDEDIIEFARHFFELGLNAQKGE